MNKLLKHSRYRSPQTMNYEGLNNTTDLYSRKARTSQIFFCFINALLLETFSTGFKLPKSGAALFFLPLGLSRLPAHNNKSNICYLMEYINI